MWILIVWGQGVSDFPFRLFCASISFYKLLWLKANLRVDKEAGVDYTTFSISKDHFNRNCVSPGTAAVSPVYVSKQGQAE
jgi:hypothetical protein